MANQSAKRNEQKIKTPVQILNYSIYGITSWFLLWNIYYLFSEQVSIWHLLIVIGVSYLNIFCLRTIVKYWEMQVPEAAEYYIDILAMNGIVSLLDFWTHQVWHMYWLILVFVLYHAGKWLWGYITPKYQQTQQTTGQDGKKQKKDKKQKIKYVKH